MSENMFAGRSFSIPYDVTADEATASMARAHIVTRTTAPGEVIQVGDRVVPIGILPAAAVKMGDLDMRLRSFDQLASPAQEAVRRNIQWQYGSQMAPQLDSKSPFEKSDSTTDDAALKKGIGRALAKLAGVDHLGAPPARKAPKLTTVDTNAGKPKTARDAVLSTVPKRAPAPADKEPVRLMATPQAPATPEGPTRLIPTTPGKPRSLFDVKTSVAAAAPVTPTHMTKPTPTPVSKPADSPDAQVPLPPVAETQPVAKPTPSARVAAPFVGGDAAAKEALAGAQTITGAVHPKPTPEPVAKPAIQSPAAKHFDEHLLDTSRNPIPDDTTEGADVSANHADEGYKGEDRRGFGDAMRKLHEMHAVSRPGFKHASRWLGDEENPTGYVSLAHHPETKTTESHMVLPGQDGTVTHVHRVTTPEHEPYEKTTQGLGSYAALHNHVKRLIEE